MKVGLTKLHASKSATLVAWSLHPHRPHVVLNVVHSLYTYKNTGSNPFNFQHCLSCCYAYVKLFHTEHIFMSPGSGSDIKPCLSEFTVYIHEKKTYRLRKSKAVMILPKPVRPPATPTTLDLY